MIEFLVFNMNHFAELTLCTSYLTYFLFTVCSSTYLSAEIAFQLINDSQARINHVQLGNRN